MAKLSSSKILDIYKFFLISKTQNKMLFTRNKFDIGTTFELLNRSVLFSKTLIVKLLGYPSIRKETNA